MNSKTQFTTLKKYDFLENLTAEGLVSQLIVYYGDAINIIKDATSSGSLHPKDTVNIVADLILLMARIDINFRRKNKTWWDGTLNKNHANLPDNQWTFISGLSLISNPLSTKIDKEHGIHLIQKSIETMAYSFNLDIKKLIIDLVNTYNVADELILSEFAPKGIFVMSLNKNKKGAYESIELGQKEFKTGVINMDFFKASMFAINTDKEFGVKISDELKTYIDNLDNFFMIKFFNNADINDNDFYTLKTEGTVNRLFRGDTDITKEVTVERKGVSLIPFINYSMVLVTPEMEKLDDLLDYYNKYK